MRTNEKDRSQVLFGMTRDVVERWACFKTDDNKNAPTGHRSGMDATTMQ
jgi:hypothetical protein